MRCTYALCKHTATTASNCKHRPATLHGPRSVPPTHPTQPNQATFTPNMVCPVRNSHCVHSLQQRHHHSVQVATESSTQQGTQLFCLCHCSSTQAQRCRVRAEQLMQQVEEGRHGCCCTRRCLWRLVGCVLWGVVGGCEGGAVWPGCAQQQLQGSAQQCNVGGSTASNVGVCASCMYIARETAAAMLSARLEQLWCCADHGGVPQGPATQKEPDKLTVQ